MHGTIQLLHVGYSVVMGSEGFGHFLTLICIILLCVITDGSEFHVVSSDEQEVQSFHW